MSDRQRLLATPASSASCPRPVHVVDTETGDASGASSPSRWQRARRGLAVAMDSAELHWTVVILALSDFLFTLAELSWELLKDKACVCSDTCEEPALVEMAGWLSATVTSLFVVEVFLDLVAFGPSHFTSKPHHWLHCFDAVVVIVAFVLEVVLRGPVERIASLLVVLRLWRVAKLLSALEVGMSEYREQTGEVEARVEGATKAEWAEEKRRLLDEVRRLRRRLARFEGDSRGSEESS
ncbi:hypothetical protein JCM8097_009509 [Rhodosporidiobolus ruineniae]